MRPSRRSRSRLLPTVMLPPVVLLFCVWRYQVVQGGSRLADSAATASSPYTIIVDGGSTGSRLHVFQRVVDAAGTERVERRGSVSAHQPLSSFAPQQQPNNIVNATAVAAHVLPAFATAATEWVPDVYHATTPVYYQATAGMRLLPEHHQTAVYDALYEGLTSLSQSSDQFPFALQRQDMQTLSGEWEGLYGVMAANYLTQRVDAQLAWKKSLDESTTPKPIGSLDMGGSSTQIVFRPQQQQQESAETTCPNNNDDGETLQGEDFFATSYLSYGVDQIRERLWTKLVEDEANGGNDSTDQQQTVSNPCAFVEHVQEWKGRTLRGTGDAEACQRHLQQLIPHPTESTMSNDDKRGTLVGGVAHPPVAGQFFLAMSMYFYGLDSLRLWSTNRPQAHAQLNAAWPTPTLHELTEALPGLCSRTWDEIQADSQTMPHKFTRPAILPHRCIESVYMVTLLRDGFGFDPQLRNIQYTHRVDGSEVEWTLGMALALNQQQKQQQQLQQEALIDNDKEATNAGSDSNETQRSGDGLWNRLDWVRSLLDTAQ